MKKPGHVMFAEHNQAIYDAVFDRQLIPTVDLDLAAADATVTGQPLADVLIRRGLIAKSGMLASFAAHLGCDFLGELPATLPNALLAELPANLARVYRVIPLRVDDRQIDLLTGNPFNDQAVEDLTFALGREVRLIFADPDAIDGLIQSCYGNTPTNPTGADPEIATDRCSPEGEIYLDDLEAVAGQAPIIRFVNQVLDQAIRDQASDIHFEPFEHEFKIRYRIDGALYEMTPPPQELVWPIISRIKVLANLNIAERRLPQDGRIALTLSGRTVDLRVSTLPTQFGESVVLRVLDQSAVHLEIEKLGLPSDVLAGIKEVIHRPNGIFIVTGPTGSGKTTTLYSGLRAINTPGLKLVTAEDPIEYEIEGIMQVPINPAIGFTFASALRSFLRQDPDVIMVGEIRDVETARVAIQASLTGHLVLSTLHTNDAAGAITRLLDLEVEPFLIASSLEGVLAQRLLRRICLPCRVAYHPTEEQLAPLQLSPSDIGHRQLFYGRGCAQCGQTGYHGRMGIFEWLRLTDAIRELIGQKAPTLAIRQKAIAEGMRSLRDDGLRAIFDGQTTIEEVVKYT